MFFPRDHNKKYVDEVIAAIIRIKNLEKSQVPVSLQIYLLISLANFIANSILYKVYRQYELLKGVEQLIVTNFSKWRRKKILARTNNSI